MFFWLLLLLFMIGRIVRIERRPLYAFEKYLTELLSARSSYSSLREASDFQHLEEIAAKVRARLFEGDTSTTPGGARPVSDHRSHHLPARKRRTGDARLMVTTLPLSNALTIGP